MHCSNTVNIFVHAQKGYCLEQACTKCTYKRHIAIKQGVDIHEAGDKAIEKNMQNTDLRVGIKSLHKQKTRIKSGIIYIEEKVKTLANQNILLKLGCDCAFVFLNTPEVQTVKKRGKPRLSAPTKMWFLGRVHRMRRKIFNCWVEYKDLIDLLDRPNNVDVGLCWYQKSARLKWSYDLIDHIMVELDTVIALANLT